MGECEISIDNIVMMNGTNLGPEINVRKQMKTQFLRLNKEFQKIENQKSAKKREKCDNVFSAGKNALLLILKFLKFDAN